MSGLSSGSMSAGGGGVVVQPSELLRLLSSPEPGLASAQLEKLENVTGFDVALMVWLLMISPVSHDVDVVLMNERCSCCRSDIFCILLFAHC